MSKFFESMNQWAQGLNGAGIPFRTEELKSLPHKGRASGPVQVEPHRKPKAEYRDVTIRVPASAPVLPFDGAHPEAAERYRIIRTRIVQHPTSPRVICVSSTTAGDGKTVTTLNIASSLALKKDTSVVMVDADLRKSQLAKLLGVDGPGLAEVLAGNCSIDQALVRIAEMPGLHFVPAGHASRNPVELLDSVRWPNLIQSLREEFDFVLIDCPPVGVVADYDLIFTAADSVAFVVRPGHSNRKLLYEAIARIPEDKLLGIVVNCAEEWFLWRSHDTYYRYA